MSILDQMEDSYEPSQDEKTMALLAHVLTYVGGFVAPLIIFLLKKDESPFVREHALESLNFQISVTIYVIGSVILIFAVIGIFLLIAIGLAAFVLVILATIKASEGKSFRYPLTLRLIQ
jgi:uncharacterized protein